MLLSIIIPVYNVEEYIGYCLDSIIKQITPSLIGNIEVICVNDGSRDNSANILKEYANKFSYIQVEHKSNGGLSSARNLGIEKAIGNYVMFLDSDDWIKDNCLSEVIKLILLDKYDLIMFKWKRIDLMKNIEVEMPSIFNHMQQIDEDNKMLLYDKIINGTTINSACNKIYKRELLNQNNIRFDEKQKYIEDLPFSTKVITYAKRSIYIDVPIINYRVNYGSLTHKYHPYYFECILNANMQLYSYAKVWGIYDNEIERSINTRVLKAILYCINQSIMYMNCSEAGEHINRIIGEPKIKDIIINIDTNQLNSEEKLHYYFFRDKKLRLLKIHIYTKNKIKQIIKRIVYR